MNCWKKSDGLNDQVATTGGRVCRNASRHRLSQPVPDLRLWGRTRFGEQTSAGFDGCALSNGFRFCGRESGRWHDPDSLQYSDEFFKRNFIKNP
jgi:hypothetical protein